MVPSVLSGTSTLCFARLFEYCLSNRGSATVEPPWRDTTSALAVTVWSKGDGSRSLFCRIVRSVVSSNSEDAGSFHSRREVADVDGGGSAKMRETLICACDCFEGARHVCIGFLFGGGVVVVVQQSLHLEHHTSPQSTSISLVSANTQTSHFKFKILQIGSVR